MCRYLAICPTILAWCIRAVCPMCIWSALTSRPNPSEADRISPRCNVEDIECKRSTHAQRSVSQPFHCKFAWHLCMLARLFASLFSIFRRNERWPPYEIQCEPMEQCNPFYCYLMCDERCIHTYILHQNRFVSWCDTETWQHAIAGNSLDLATIFRNFALHYVENL